MKPESRMSIECSVQTKDVRARFYIRQVRL